MIEIHIDDEHIRRALNNLQRASSNLRPALKEIGKTLKESTHKRFETTTSPDGSAWPLNSVLSTLLYKEGDRPLTDGGILGDTINYRLLGNDAVEIGSPMKYAAMQQFGGKKSEFPKLWGDIPARPFLGISDDDKNDILTIIHDHLSAAFTP